MRCTRSTTLHGDSFRGFRRFQRIPRFPSSGFQGFSGFRSFSNSEVSVDSVVPVLVGRCWCWCLVQSAGNNQRQPKPRSWFPVPVPVPVPSPSPSPSPSPVCPLRRFAVRRVNVRRSVSLTHRRFRHVQTFRASADSLARFLSSPRIARLAERNSDSPASRTSPCAGQTRFRGVLPETQGLPPLPTQR